MTAGFLDALAFGLGRSEVSRDNPEHCLRVITKCHGTHPGIGRLDIPRKRFPLLENVFHVLKNKGGESHNASLTVGNGYQTKLRELAPLRPVAQERGAGPDSASIRKLVVACRERQLVRAGCSNAKLEQQQVRQHCALDARDKKMLTEAVTRLRLSARATFRVLKIARTIANLEDSERIASSHVLEAINYRRFDTL